MTAIWGWVRDFARFWYEFVVGDDWTIAAGVVAALAATYGILRAGLPAWWLLPPAGAAIAAYAVVRANRAAAQDEPEADAADAPLYREQHENGRPQPEGAPEETTSAG